MTSFYGPEQVAVHHARFGDLAARAAQRLRWLLAQAGHTGGTVVDLGCGTGILARHLTEAGFDVIGVDLSADMVALARQHAPAATFRCESIHDTVIPAGVVAVTAIGEVLNYATDDRAGMEGVGDLSRRIAQAILPGGVFLTDVAAPGRHGADPVVMRIHEGDGWYLAMRATEDVDHRMLRREITIFTATGERLWRRTDELHVLRLYDPDAVAALLEAEGWEVSLDADFGARTTSTPPSGWRVVTARWPSGP